MTKKKIWTAREAGRHLKMSHRLVTKLGTRVIIEKGARFPDFPSAENAAEAITGKEPAEFSTTAIKRWGKARDKARKAAEADAAKAAEAAERAREAATGDIMARKAEKAKARAEEAARRSAVREKRRAQARDALVKQVARRTAELMEGN